MADQLRWDYLSCYGHKTLCTPNIDRLATLGVRFNRAYVQSPVCGPSRMSCYTGRYVRSHGATWNGFPLRVGEPTLGEHLRQIGVRCVLVGKTHMVPDREGMERLGIEPASTISAIISECGFEAFERDDGTHPDGYSDMPPAYNDYLRRHGMGGDNPWEEWANSAEGPNGELLSGWLLENAHLPARVPEAHSETTYMTGRAIDFIEGAGDGPWLCHLSYIKPHWPYLAPAPYNDMYTAADLQAPVRSDAELNNDHPILAAWRNQRVCRSFSRDEVRERVGPVYMGLIKQLDDQIGRLLAYLEDTGRLKNTMVVFTSDHGDNLGDHWLGEKDLFYDCSARVPLIVFDPRSLADKTRGTVSEALVEAIDLAPTFLDFFGGRPKPHILEGHSLVPLLRGADTSWRRYVFSEYDYATREARIALGIDQAEARLIMVFDGRWKLMHAEGFRPLLFDLQNDPDELYDLTTVPGHEPQVVRLTEALCAWLQQHHTRITVSPEKIEAMTVAKEPPGILIGYWNAREVLDDGMRAPRIKEIGT